jgi:hypothetical protein
MSTLTLNLTVSDAARKAVEDDPKRGKQLGLPHDISVALREEAGMEDGQYLSKADALEVLVRTPKGNEFPVVVGDTHAVHLSHQHSNLATKFLTWAWENGGCEGLEVVSVERTTVRGAGKSPSLAPTASMDECPI